MQSTRYNKFATNLAPESMASQRTRHRTRGALQAPVLRQTYHQSSKKGNLRKSRQRRHNPLYNAPIATVPFPRSSLSTAQIVIVTSILGIYNDIVMNGRVLWWTMICAPGAQNTLKKNTTSWNAPYVSIPCTPSATPNIARVLMAGVQKEKQTYQNPYWETLKT